MLIKWNIRYSVCCNEFIPVQNDIFKKKKSSKGFFFSEFKVVVGIAKSLWQFIHDSDKNVYWTGLMKCVRILLVST